MKRLLVALVTLLFAGGFLVTVAQARPAKRYDQRTQMCRFLAQGQLDWDSEPWGKGGHKFQEVCMSCHGRNKAQEATFLHAGSRTSDGWNRIFAKRRVKCARDGAWDVLSEDELQAVNDYLYRNGDLTFDPNSSDSCG